MLARVRVRACVYACMAVGCRPAGDVVCMHMTLHHVADARAVIGALAGLLAPGGRLLVSLRIGPVPQGQPLHALDAEAETDRAALAGLVLLRRHEAPAHDAETAAAGIGWTWLALSKEPAP